MEGDGSEMQAQALIWSHAYGYVQTSLLKCAMDLKIADVIHSHGEPMPLSRLGMSLSIASHNTDNLRRMMRSFEHMGLFTVNNKEGEEEKYWLTPASKFLVTSEDKNLVAYLRIIDPKILESSNIVGSCLKGETASPCQKVHGESIWNLTSKSPDYNKLFNEAMACDAKIVSSALIDYGSDIFREIKSLVDVGGGTGTASQAISKAFPHIKCTILDLPHVVEMSPSCAGVDRVAGDMFSSIPHADAVMLMWTLHNWSDEDCLKILKNCKEAIQEKRGKVIIVDIIIGMKEESEFSDARFALDMNMMALVGGKERSEKEWRELLMSAGFSHCKITPIKALQSVIEASLYYS